MKDVDTAVLGHIKNVIKPKVIIANTLKGKGISFMENQTKWTTGVPNKEEYQAAMLELEINQKDKYFLRIYRSQEDAGKSYDAVFTALKLQDLSGDKFNDNGYYNIS